MPFNVCFDTICCVLTNTVAVMSRVVIRVGGRGVGSRIQTIPNELEALTKLKHLRLGYNRIGGFRGNIYLMSSLQTLDLGHNR